MGLSSPDPRGRKRHPLDSSWSALNRRHKSLSLILVVLGLLSMSRELATSMVPGRRLGRRGRLRERRLICVSHFSGGTGWIQLAKFQASTASSLSLAKWPFSLPGHSLPGTSLLLRSGPRRLRAALPEPEHPYLLPHVCTDTGPLPGPDASLTLQLL